jgi:zinc protease
MLRAILTLLLLLWAQGVGAVTIGRVTSPAGVEVWLVEDRSLPLVTLRFAIAGGAALDPAGKAGLATMAAGLLDEGAGPYDAAAFKTRLEDLAIDLRFEAGRDEFNGSLRCLKRNLDEAIDLLRQALMAPRFEQGAVERVRSEIVASLSRQAQSPRALSGRLWMREAFERHPYGANISGTPESIGAITRDDLSSFATQRLNRAGLVIGVVGDVTKDEAVSLVDQVFGGLPAGAADVTIVEARPVENGGLLITRRSVPQSAVAFGQSGLQRENPDWYAARLVTDILGGGFRGRLMQEIREKRGLAYGVSSSLISFRHAGLIIGNVATANARVAESIALIRAEWRRMRDQGPTEAELDDAKSYLIGSFPLSLDTSGRLAALLVEMQIEKLGIDYLDHRAALFGAVSLNAARRVAHTLLDPDGLSFVVVGDPVGLSSTRTVADP